MEGPQDPEELQVEAESSQMKQKRKRKKKGSKQSKLSRKKDHTQAEKTRRLKLLETDESSESSKTESSFATGSDSHTSASYGKHFAEPASSCQHSVSELHLCSESDSFSETVSESFAADETESEESSLPKTAHPESGDEDEDVDVCGDDIEKPPLAVVTKTAEDDILESLINEPTIEKEGQCETAQSSSSSPDAIADAAQSLVNNLTILLPPEWSTDIIKKQIVRIINLNQSEKASVLSSIFWDVKSKSWGIFIRGKMLPKESKIFKSVALPEEGNIGSLADFLFRVVKLLKNLNVCVGVTKYQDFWRSRNEGYIDSISPHDSPCLRSYDCLLTVASTNAVCSQCRSLQFKLERSQKRKERGDSMKASHAPDHNISLDEMREKKENYKKLFKKEKLRADRLEEQVGRLKVKLDRALKDELTSILIKNEHKMTDLQKMFWKSQREALAAKDKKGVRWHPMMVRIALHIHSTSPGNYDYLKKTGILQLPSARRLYDYSHFIEAQEGCQKGIIDDMLKKIHACGPEDHYSYINLMFDEMHIRAGLVTLRSTGELIGFTNLTNTERELQEMQDSLTNKSLKPKLAKKILVYLAHGVTCEALKDVVAVYSTDDLSAVQLYNRTWEVIYHLEDAGVKVISLTFDGASINRKFILMHESLDKTSKVTYVTKNLKSGDSRPLFFIVDPPHLLKTVRNALANSFCHRKSRKLWKNNETLSWEVFEKLYELTKSDKHRGHKLTKAHIKLTSFSCMTVSYATQLFSNSVAQCLEELSHHEAMELFDTTELLKFVRLMNRFFDCLNGQEKVKPEEETNGASCSTVRDGNPDLAAFRSSNDPRLAFLENKFLGFFEDWKKDVSNRPGIYSDSERSRMIISHQSLAALVVTVKSFIGVTRYMLDVAKAPYVNARVFNQDPLEQYFSKMRRKHGDNRQPGLKSVLDSRLNLHAQGHAALPSSKGNTKQDVRQLEVDSSPLPVRKKRKKDS